MKRRSFGKVLFGALAAVGIPSTRLQGKESEEQKSDESCTQYALLIASGVDEITGRAYRQYQLIYWFGRSFPESEILQPVCYPPEHDKAVNDYNPSKRGTNVKVKGMCLRCNDGSFLNYYYLHGQLVEVRRSNT